MKELSKELIPSGQYCYTIESIDNLGKIKIKPCPYHKTLDAGNGFCEFLNISDAEDGSMLWDMIKECQENLGELDEESC